MQTIFLYGGPAAGKLTVARELARRTGFALFHNHLVVDAVGSVLPFGTPPFIKLREDWWLAMFDAAARADRSLIFTFAPEPTVTADFPDRAARLVHAAGSLCRFVRLVLSAEEQERRLANPDRAAFDKMRSLDLLHQLRPKMEACEAAMPEPELTIDTGVTSAPDAADRIVRDFRLTC